MTSEETQRRNELSMRRKQQTNASAALSATAIDGAPPSPASTGAMDSLLEKLRAAAPQTRDTRDRRRRARLNDRHQKRVASGQQIPEIEDVASPTTTEPPVSPPRPGSSNPSLTASEATDTISEGEDVADRAASLMQSLRGAPDAEGSLRDDSLRVRRRRESADDERSRRRRRRAGQTSTSDVTKPGISIPEEAEDSKEVSKNDDGDGTATESTDILANFRKSLGNLETPLNSPSLPSPPITIVSPPSPKGSVKDEGSEPEGFSTPMEMPTPELSNEET